MQRTIVRATRNRPSRRARGARIGPLGVALRALRGDFYSLGLPQHQ